MFEAHGHDRRWRKPASGIAHKTSGLQQITVLLDPDTVEEIRTQAKASQRSFSSVLRDLVEWGMEAGSDG